MQYKSQMMIAIADSVLPVTLNTDKSIMTVKPNITTYDGSVLLNHKDDMEEKLQNINIKVSTLTEDTIEVEKAKPSYNYNSVYAPGPDVNPTILSVYEYYANYINTDVNNLIDMISRWKEGVSLRDVVLYLNADIFCGQGSTITTLFSHVNSYQVDIRVSRLQSFKNLTRFLLNPMTNRMINTHFDAKATYGYAQVYGGSIRYAIRHLTISGGGNIHYIEGGDQGGTLTSECIEFGNELIQLLTAFKEEFSLIQIKSS